MQLPLMEMIAPTVHTVCILMQLPLAVLADCSQPPHCCIVMQLPHQSILTATLQPPLKEKG